MHPSHLAQSYLGNRANASRIAGTRVFHSSTAASTHGRPIVGQQCCRRRGLHGRAVAVSHQASTSTLTEKLLQQIDRHNTSGMSAGGAGGSNTYQALLRADEAWLRLRNMPEGKAAGPAPKFVHLQTSALPRTTNTNLINPATVPAGTAATNKNSSSSNSAVSIASTQSSNNANSAVWDVAVCGGTLGIFLAAALAKQGLRVVVIERGPLRGRSQEWNISRKEMHELVEAGILTDEELEAAISMEFNPVRVGFKGAGEVWTRDVLNLGVQPDLLIQTMRKKLESLGGAVVDNTALEGVMVHTDGVCLQLGENKSIHARLVVDCMGHASPIVKQVRWGRKPDGVCIVVGTLAAGFTNNNTADVIYTHTDLQPQNSELSRLQLFWEAFPAGSGPTDRTTYMFTYMDAESWRPSMTQLFEEYWPLMCDYQGVNMADLTFKRALFGLFPTYRDSPLKPAFDRIIQIGDASGIQSPLSFGGFGALTRHLRRITAALTEALQADALDAGSLAHIHSYNPGLSSSWMLQRAMSVRKTDSPPQDLINRMLGGNFKAMEKLGDPVMKPFLQDVIQLRPLLSTMTQQMIQDPKTVPQLLAHVGPGPLADWMKHVGGLAMFTALHKTLGRATLSYANNPSMDPKQRYKLRRMVESWEFGAGLDYRL